MVSNVRPRASFLRRSAQAFAAILVLLAAQGLAAERIPVDLSPDLSPHWLSGAATNPLSPAAGRVAVVGELSAGAVPPADPSRVRLRLPDGSVAPLLIDERSVVREFGRVAFLRFAASVPASAINSEGFAVEYGDDVQSSNTLVCGLAVDPARLDAFRVAVPARAAARADGSPDARELRLSVIADRQQSRVRWVYLLPILLVLAGPRAVRRDDASPKAEGGVS